MLDMNVTQSQGTSGKGAADLTVDGPETIISRLCTKQQGGPQLLFVHALTCTAYRDAESVLMNCAECAIDA